MGGWAPAEGGQPHLCPVGLNFRMLCLLSGWSLVARGWLLAGAGDLLSFAAMSWHTELFVYVLVHKACGPGQGKTVRSVSD